DDRSRSRGRREDCGRQGRAHPGRDRVRQERAVWTRRVGARPRALAARDVVLDAGRSDDGGAATVKLLICAAISLVAHVVIQQMLDLLPPLEPTPQPVVATMD